MAHPFSTLRDAMSSEAQARAKERTAAMTDPRSVIQAAIDWYAAGGAARQDEYMEVIKVAHAEIERLSHCFSEASTREEKMRGTLLWLNMLGGLGHEKHERINAALGVEYPKFCKHPDKCAGKGRCMADWVCND